MIMVDTFLIIGTTGMALLLAAFLANLIGRLPESDPRYTGANLVGAVLLTVYALQLESYPFLILELVWAGAAGYRLVNSLGKGPEHV